MAKCSKLRLNFPPPGPSASKRIAVRWNTATSASRSFSLLRERLFDQSIRLLAHCVGKIVPTLRVLDDQPIRNSVEAEDWAGFAGHAVHARRAEVIIIRRRADEHAP